MKIILPGFFFLVALLIFTPSYSADLIITSANNGIEGSPTVYDGGSYDCFSITNAQYVTIKNASFLCENSGSGSDMGVGELSGSSNITIDNCTIDGRDSGGEDDAACHLIDIVNCDNITITNNVMTQYADDAIETSGSNTNLIVRGNTITECYGCGTDGACGPCDNGHGDALEFWGVAGCTIEDNFIHITDATSALITGTGNSDFTLTNNVIYTPGCGFSLYFYNDINGVKVYNNTIWQAIYGGIALNSTPTNLYIQNNIVQAINYNHLGGSEQGDHYIDYNLIGETGQGYSTNSNDIVDSDPEFTVCPALDGQELLSPSASDFQLQETSPAIDKGTTGDDVPIDDYGGANRSEPDMGAWEYITTTPSISGGVFSGVQFGGD
jgi:hypothetical protein